MTTNDHTPSTYRFSLDSRQYRRNMLLVIGFLGAGEIVLVWITLNATAVVLLGILPILVIMAAFQVGVLLEYLQVQRHGALIVDANGIELRGVHQVRVSWDDLVRFNKRQVDRDNIYYGFELRHPITLERSRLMQALFGADETDFLAVDAAIDIPTKSDTSAKSVDYAALRETEFGQAIARYKPELLEWS